ncbi:MAG: TlyA family RNA methyltransferase [Deltaproteobacteria bacterium]|nr:TlyA family RNA methyltransferase [Deltaproteobacteria bacterium]
MARVRLDKLLVDRGLAPSRERARALIMEGKVLVSDRPAEKPGSMVEADAELRFRGEDLPYVSRGGLKLAHALEHFALDVTGLVALDAGASTGGFTDVLLQRGAARVYAVDVGYGQLAWSLRQDPRVVVIERQNLRYLERERVPEALDLGVCDLSFISLTLVLDKLAELLAGPGSAAAGGGAGGAGGAGGLGGKPLVALIKPQFEVGKGNVGKGGVVRDAVKRQEAVDAVLAFARARGWQVGGVVESPIPGPAGNIEFLALLRTPTAP